MLNATGAATAFTIGGTAYTTNTIAITFSCIPSCTSIALTTRETATAVTVAGTKYSADTMKADLCVVTTPTFTENITLPSPYTAPTAPTSTQLGYTIISPCTVYPCQVVLIL